MKTQEIIGNNRKKQENIGHIGKIEKQQEGHLEKKTMKHRTNGKNKEKEKWEAQEHIRKNRKYEKIGTQQKRKENMENVEHFCFNKEK